MLRSSAGGKLTANPLPGNGATRYQPGTKVTVTAAADTGYVLKSVTVDGVAASSPADVVMSQDHAVEAAFEPGGPVDPDGGTSPDGSAVKPPASGGGSGGCSSGGGTSSRGGGSVALALATLVALGARRRVRRR